MGLDFKLEHLASGATFKMENVGLSVYTESFDSSWNAEQVFGRMDPILSYSGTRRKLNFELRVAQQDSNTSNINQAETMAEALFPTYNNENALSLKDPPLVRIKFANLLRAGQNKGLLCAIESLSVDRGTRYFRTAFEQKDANATNTKNDSTTKEDILVPNSVILKFSIIPLHEYEQGWFEVAETGSYSNLSGKAKVYKFGSSDASKTVFFSTMKDGSVHADGKPMTIKKKK